MNTIVKCWTRFGHTSGRKCLQSMATRHMSVEWHLMSAVCLQRSPQIVPEMNWLEKKMSDVLHTVETNGSLYCDHEMRHFEDVRRAQRMAAGDKVDEKDLDAASKQTAQDFEEYYNQLLTQFSKSPRITQSDVTNDRKSLDRCLDRHLMLVCRQRLGDTVEEWLLPQATNSGAEETMRQTAERALKQFCSSPELEVQFLGNVPSAVYSYRYPSAHKPRKSFTDPNVAKLGFSKAMSQKWIVIDKTSNKPIVKRKVDAIEDEVQLLLNRISHMDINEVNEQQKQDLKKRKLIQEVIVKSYDIEKGENFSLNVEKQETDITGEMIAKGSWKEKHFKDYNFDAMGIPPERGHLHPLLKVREQFRQIFLEMGFTEMPTNRYVESSFWNFDALFVPQKHPARDLQDTFFLSDPQTCNEVPVDYMARVKQVHSCGDFGSQGYQYEWKTEETQKNVLRTHTTAISARMLYDLAQECKGKAFRPVKLFSIDRVFRNESLDATHLAEFHQIEGVVADVGLTLGDLMGIIREFFQKLGIGNLRFKPTYNPYTEPSMEMYSYHEGLNKWVEIGNSGVFRPEMLLPMGLPPNVNALGWGLGLERPTMIKYGINNIRDLCGHKMDLQLVYDNPLCIL